MTPLHPPPPDSETLILICVYFTFQCLWDSGILELGRSLTNCPFFPLDAALNNGAVEISAVLDLMNYVIEIRGVRWHIRVKGKPKFRMLVFSDAA